MGKKSVEFMECEDMKQIVYTDRDIRRMFEFVIGIKRKGLYASERIKWPVLANLKRWAAEAVRANARCGRYYAVMVSVHKIADAIEGGRPIAKKYREGFARRASSWRFDYGTDWLVFSQLEFGYNDFRDRVTEAAALQNTETIEFLKTEFPHSLGPAIRETIQ